MKKVAVGDGLPSGLKEMLNNEGFEVVGSYRGQDVDAVITAGLDNNVMNMQDIKDDVPVIDAGGKTPEDIIKRLREIKLR